MKIATIPAPSATSPSSTVSLSPQNDGAGASDRGPVKGSSSEEWKVATCQSIGYPMCLRPGLFDEAISNFRLYLNNIGDPYAVDGESGFRANTHTLERSVLRRVCELWGYPADLCWGYLTANGTEGNLQGLWVAREYLGSDSVLYFSSDAHYSIKKIANLLRLRSCVIQTQENGEMDLRDLDRALTSMDAEALSRDMPQGYPAIVLATLGTTMKGAIDDVNGIHHILRKHGKKQNSYLHADGALMGFVLPFIETDLLVAKRIHSISMSGHKYLGLPFPAGLFLMDKPLRNRIAQGVEYIGTSDCTVSGSRNGHAALFFDTVLNSKTREEFRLEILSCFYNAEYLIDRINEEVPGVEAWRNTNSFTVVLDRPSPRLVKKWQLASEGSISHVICMPHITRETLDAFVEDLKEEHSSK